MEYEKILAAVDDAKHERDTVLVEDNRVGAIQTATTKVGCVYCCWRATDGESSDGRTAVRCIIQHSQTTGGKPERVKPIVQDELVKNWQKARKVFQDMNNTHIGISEVVRNFRKRGWELSEKNAGQIVRTAMNNKPDVFEHDVKEGKYYLKE